MEGLRESLTSYFDPGDTAARKISNTACTLDFATNIEGGEVRVNYYTIDPPRYRGKALKKHWEVLGLYDQGFSVHLSFGYTPNELSAAGVTEEELRLLKSDDEGLSWTEVPCDVLSDVNRVKTRHPQTSLSLWAIAGSKAAIPPGAWQAYE